MERLTPAMTSEEIAGCLPKNEYTANYQPDYDDPDAVREAVHEVQSTEMVTTPRQVDQLQDRLTALVRGESKDKLAITGRCAEEVNLETPVATLVEQGLRNIAVVRAKLGQTAIHMVRAMGQSAKPRSAATETLPDGTVIPSYMGDMVHSADNTPKARKPDPSRMVAAALQGRDMQAGLTTATGGHVNAAHEALLLPYEMASIFENPETGKRYLLSADMPWIGKRTNSVDGPHVKLLEGLANPVGIKLGADSTPGHIAGLQAKLNPENVDGKLTFMVRVGNEEKAELQNIVAAIAEHAPNAVLMFDIHGITQSIDGHKIRALSDIKTGVKMMSDVCHEAGLTLHGVHLETVMDDDRLECVATPDQIPTHPGGIDPQLNPAQLAELLEEISDYLLRPTGKELARQEQDRQLKSPATKDDVWSHAMGKSVADGYL